MDLLDNVRICVYFVIISVLIRISQSQYTTETKEYCLLESLSPTCGPNQVAIVTSAIYGRMRVGRCVQTDFFIGCSVNVLDIADRLCSGRTGCEVPVPNTEMTRVLTCLKDRSISPYLEASYMCQRVYQPDVQICHGPQKIQLSRTKLPIASVVSRNTSCGLHGSPWIIEAKEGQTLSVSLLDFSWDNNTIDNRPSVCPVKYGYILDMTTDDVIYICGGTRHRLATLHISAGHSVQIILEENAVKKYNFVIKYKAIGCPNYQSPPHTWTKINNDTLTIGCQSSDQIWKLKCIDNKWLGMAGKCPQSPNHGNMVTEAASGHSRDSGTSNQGQGITDNHVIVVILACLTVVVCAVTIILGVFCIKRYDAKMKKQRYQTPTGTINLRDGTLNLRDGYLPQEMFPTIYRPFSTLQYSRHNIPNPLVIPEGEGLPAVPPRNPISHTLPTNFSASNNHRNVAYQNVMSDGESVKYYILENNSEPSSPTERLYQSISMLHR